MHFEVFYQLSNPYLPVEYRRGFASLIKEALRCFNFPLFNRYYARPHILKPFTFSVYFPGLSGQEGDQFNVGQVAILNFSTRSGEYELVANVYNGLLKQRVYPLFENRLQLEYLRFLPERAITSNSAIFKTMAPVLVNNKGKVDWYLLPDEEGFEEGLHFAVQEVCRTFLGFSEAEIEFKGIALKRKVVRHYGMNMQGFVGVFELRGRPEVLNLIYHIGLGVRRSQGFGMLELVKQGSLSEHMEGGSQ